MEPYPQVCSTVAPSLLSEVVQKFGRRLRLPVSAVDGQDGAPSCQVRHGEQKLAVKPAVLTAWRGGNNILDTAVMVSVVEAAGTS